MSPSPSPVRATLSGVGRGILFVEDEDAVRVVAARLLRARGYEVIEAADGEEALALAELHAGQIDLLISDVIMPGRDGPALVKKARQFLGSAPVMFISGYAEAEFSGHAGRRDRRHFPGQAAGQQDPGRAGQAAAGGLTVRS